MKNICGAQNTTQPPVEPCVDVRRSYKFKFLQVVIAHSGGRQVRPRAAPADFQVELPQILHSGGC